MNCSLAARMSYAIHDFQSGTRRPRMSWAPQSIDAKRRPRSVKRLNDSSTSVLLLL